MSYDYFYGQSGELFSYFRIPKALFQDRRFRQLSTDARTLYGILLDRMSLSAKNGWLDEQGRVYIIYTVREVQESLCCAEHKAVKLFRELEDIDLIERKRRGLGRPSLIYVKDFSSGLPKAQVQNCPNSNSGAAESAILVQSKPQANKTDKNKTEWNDPDPIYSGGIREQLEDYFYQALEVDLLLRLCPDDEDTIYQIVDLLVDTCSTKRKMLRISGDTVRRFIRLTNLIPELLDMVDEKKIAFNPAVELSYLDESQQRDFLEAMEDTQNAPSLSQAQQLKKMAQQGEFSYEKAFDVMGQEKKSEKDTVTIKNETLRKYFPRSYTPKQMEEKIIQLLDAWQKKQQRRNER